MATAPPSPHPLPVAVALPPAEPPAPAGAFASLRHGDFRLLIGGTLASGFAQWMKAIGQGWLVHELTHLPFHLGLVQFLRGFSILFVSPLAGAIAERVDPKKLAGWRRP